MRVLQIAAQELGILHTDLVQAVAQRRRAGRDATQVCAYTLVVWVDALAPLRRAVSAKQAMRSLFSISVESYVEASKHAVWCGTDLPPFQTHACQPKLLTVSSTTKYTCCKLYQSPVLVIRVIIISFRNRLWTPAFLLGIAALTLRLWSTHPPATARRAVFAAVHTWRFQQAPKVRVCLWRRRRHIITHGAPIYGPATCRCR